MNIILNKNKEKNKKKNKHKKTEKAKIRTKKFTLSRDRKQQQMTFFMLNNGFCLLSIYPSQPFQPLFNNIVITYG